jgi:hypothetical protein
VSHIPERKEKNCLNCGAEVQGRFCQICGQENIEPKESFWHLVTHFMYDITHFDGKFFSTLKYLLFKPGFLSHEYLRGRRASYLHPIRMYVFTSAIFFLVFFSLKNEESIVTLNEKSNGKAKKQTAAQVMKKLTNKREDLKESLSDSMPAIAKTAILSAIAQTDSNIALLKRDTTAKDKVNTGSNNNLNFFGGNKNNRYGSIDAYDSAQKKLPEAERDNFIERKFTKQNIHLREKYHEDGKAMWEAILEKFKHMFPQMLFCSLPLFALLLQLLYVRRKSFFYVNHVVFTIHLYCGTFIIILVYVLLDALLKKFSYHNQTIGLVFMLSGFFYWYKSMRNFYEQRRGKTILKYLLVLFLSVFLMSILFTLFFVFSAMAI